jgi:hypothetical protein
MALNQAGDLYPFTEVVPASASFGSPERSSILTQRRRCRVTPQTGANYGSNSAGTGGGNSQLQFLIADQGGLIDMRSVVINYTLSTSGTSSVPDDGHPFTTVQVLMNGQLMDNIQNAMKLTNIEMKAGGSKTYYQSAGSFQGFELLNNDLATSLTSALTITGNTTTVGTANGLAGTTASIPAWGFVQPNLADINARTTRASSVKTGNYRGEPRSIPLGLISGVGRMKTYLPIALTGELSLVLITGSAREVMFQQGTQADCDYSLANVSIEYDIVVPDQRYMSLLQKIASDPSDAGLNMPFESSIVTAGASITASASALTENTVIVSRATNHLLRAHIVQIPTALLQSQNYPSQSCFGHAGLFSYQFRIGSQVYPQVATQGDASMFNTSLSAYGSVTQENGSVVNRALWSVATDMGTTPGTIKVYETAETSASTTAIKFGFADSCIPSYGFQTVKGGSEPLDVDGVSLAGASGSQLIASLVSCPSVAYTPFICLVALKFLKASGGAVTVIGA